MTTPDCSIILIAYNVEGYIERAIASALNQQGLTLEVIVVDDASTDSTWAVICRNRDPRLKCFRHERNGGPSVARNTAIAQATGVWLAVLDADDLFLPGRLLRCLDLARKQNADIVVDNVTVYREVENESFPMFPPDKFAAIGRIDLAGFIAGNKLFLGGYTLGYVKPVFSAAFLQQHHLAYDPDIRVGEDYLLLAEALASGANCAVEPSQGYQYTVRAGSISGDGLSLDHFTRISAGDAKLLARYRLSSAAIHAQKEQQNCLKKAHAFTMLVAALKHKDRTAALKAIACCPGCIWLLWMPTFISGQTHAVSLLEQDGGGLKARTTHITKALIKSFVCCGAAMIYIINPHRRQVWLNRGSMHAGVVARLLGFPMLMTPALPIANDLNNAQSLQS